MATNNIPYIAEISQDQRFLQALDPASCPIDGRRPDQLVDFAHQYAQLLHYYNQDNQVQGNWQSFFPAWKDFFADKQLTKSDQWLQQLPEDLNKEIASRPHLALFFTFVQLLRHAQTDFAVDEP